MTIQMNGQDVMEIVQIVAVLGSILAMFIAGLVIYLIVRPSRRSKAPPPRRALDESEAEEMVALVERMERRLAVVEQLMLDERPRIARPDPRIAPRTRSEQDQPTSDERSDDRRTQ